MEQFLEVFTKTSLERKIAILVGALILIFVLDFMFVMQGQWEKRDELSEREDQLQVNLLDKQQKAKDLMGFRREVERLKQRLREAEEQLPKRSEIPKLLKDIEYEGQQSGLVVTKFQLRPEQQQGTFSAVPVAMTVKGSYHEIAVFLDRLSKLPRIVNVTNIDLGGAAEVNKKLMLTSSYTATTYRFLESKQAQ